ncbi:MAG: glycerate kinase [Limisphaerales bacterium]
MRVLIIPDKFKGTLTADAAARAIAAGWRRARPGDRLTLLPMSDGGDGFGTVLSGLLGACARELRTVDAAGRPLAVKWWWHADTRTAILESARIVGLTLLQRGEFHPSQLDTTGLGLALAQIFRLRPRRVLIGLGGSATNDAGFGLARALGGQFFSTAGEPLERWTDLRLLGDYTPPAIPPGIEIIAAVDVHNPLFGKHGATHTYGPQKGLLPGELADADACLRRLALRAAKSDGRKLHLEPGAGAAGGLGFGLMRFLNARVESGFGLFGEAADLEGRLRRHDLVITAEGAVDRQSAMGKGTGEVLRLAREAGRPAVVLGGRVEMPNAAKLGVVFARGLTDITSPECALAEPAKHLRELARLAAEQVA